MRTSGFIHWPDLLWKVPPYPRRQLAPCGDEQHRLRLPLR